MKRIHKLLHAEYEELLVRDETLLLESAFAETTRDGFGLRQVSLGLTNNKLIIASDNLGDSGVFSCAKNVDASIECLQLKSVYPLEFVKLSVFKRKKRKALEAKLIDGRAKYYELGGLECRARNWKDWCMQIRKLIRDSDETPLNNYRQQSCNGWTKKHLYLGPDYEELWDEHYVPKPVLLPEASFETVKNELIAPNTSRRRKKIARRVSRFAEGVDENCSHALYIPISQSSSENLTIHREISPNFHILRGLGPWTINPGDQVSLQSRLTQSLACVRRQSSELRLPISKRHLTRVTASSLKLRVSTSNALLFWTTDYWYRPRSSVDIYRHVKRYLNGLNPLGTTIRLRDILKVNRRVTLCEITSTTLSRQLILIESELFGRITSNDLRNHGDATNFYAWIAFSHRLSCLLQCEILRLARIDERARILLRLIRTAMKCLDMGNFQSACTIVVALQSPAVYRLKATWAYLQTHHETKYKVMAKLSKLFSNTNARHYCDAWMTIENDNRPGIPSIPDVIDRILGFKDADGNSKIRIDCETLNDRFNRLTSWLENCQSRAFNYDYPSESVAWEFLLKARYREDRENFMSSVCLEPSTRDS